MIHIHDLRLPTLRRADTPPSIPPSTGGRTRGGWPRKERHPPARSHFEILAGSCLTLYGCCRNMAAIRQSSYKGEQIAMTKDVPSLGELEIRVLRLVWEHQPCTERHVSDLVQAERDVARTTVLKTMQRLEGKGLLLRASGRGPVKF